MFLVDLFGFEPQPLPCRLRNISDLPSFSRKTKDLACVVLDTIGRHEATFSEFHMQPTRSTTIRGHGVLARISGSVQGFVNKPPGNRSTLSHPRMQTCREVIIHATPRRAQTECGTRSAMLLREGVPIVDGAPRASGQSPAWINCGFWRRPGIPSDCSLIPGRNQVRCVRSSRDAD